MKTVRLIINNEEMLAHIDYISLPAGKGEDLSRPLYNKDDCLDILKRSYNVAKKLEEYKEEFGVHVLESKEYNVRIWIYSHFRQKYNPENNDTFYSFVLLEDGWYINT